MCRDWRSTTDSDDFWHVISLRGRTLQVPKVVRLLQKRTCVQELDARGVRFSPSDLAEVLPGLTALHTLELEKGAYDDRELAALSAHLPALTRLVLAGGAVGNAAQHLFHHHVPGGPGAEWPTLVRLPCCCRSWCPLPPHARAAAACWSRCCLCCC